MKSAANLLSLIVNCQWSVVIIFISFLFSLFTLTLALPRQAHAQCNANPNNSQEAINAFNRCAIETDIFDDKIFNFNQIAGTTDSLNTLLYGTSQLHPQTNALTRDNGALAASGRLIASLYNPPISGVEYFAGKMRDFNPVKPAYAQTGIGFLALGGAQQLWTLFRNLAYVGFVIVFIIVGFMIMFRAHISPQAVATIQDAIPRIIVALILVTFSYAIAGLMLDFMFVIINLAIVIFTAPGLLEAGGAQRVFEESFLKVITSSWGDIVSATAATVNELIHQVLSGGGIPGFIEDIVGFFGGSIGGLIIGIAVLIMTFRIFFMLLMAYVMIIVLTVVAPLFFLFQAIPGQNAASGWFRQMASNVAVFPTVAIMLLFAAFLGGISHLGGGNVGSPLGGEALRFPLLAGGFNQVSSLVAIGLLLLTPEAANLVRRAFGTAQGPNLAGAAMATAGAGGAALGATGRWAMGGYGSPIANKRRIWEIRRQADITKDVYKETGKPTIPQGGGS